MHFIEKPGLLEKKILKNVALAGCGSVERQPVNQKVTGLIPGQGAGLGCGPDPQLGACERQPINVSLTHCCFSPSFSLPSSLNK